MDRPEFPKTRRLGRADQLVWIAAQEVSARLISERPSTGTVFSDANLEAGSRISLL